MSRVFWVRHGPTHETAFVGHRDVPADLSDTAQIARIDRDLPDAAIVVSSDLSRAVDTADAIQNTRHRLPHNPNLREFDFGDWDGLHHSDVTARDPDLVRRFWETPGDLAAPGGESWNMVAARVSAAIDAIITRNPRRDIIAVAHIGVIMTQIQRASGCTAYQAMSHQIANFSITEIQMWPIRGIARINHLP
ncbi:MAG: histidine phosphatase family protein [Thalassobium sp.]|uniref:histidine phosphatase family protein n=1 Tax=Octadecabacter sp. SW4 TaxID=2602067 RepID=UPI000C0CE88D|nr:histidine phosphatase family protein [Octadecabacter sp. SW4]PHQ85192.1 MAG: histidine phosphatase family protein [Thalassobium sp.]QEE36644.1 histidine phosphatase family protein [Octadecabacter sp. SW4]|tara:strand:- start:594 stop:1169 length:576 start_codon:yes stop_codon:yes gene_type:complete